MLANGDARQAANLAGYLRCLMPGLPLVLLLSVLSKFITQNGEPKTASLLLLLANVATIVAAYLLIAVWGWGIEGAALAIEDAAVLTRCLADVPSIPAALDAYAEARATRVKQVQRAARANGQTRSVHPAPHAKNSRPRPWPKTGAARHRRHRRRARRPHRRPRVRPPAPAIPR